MRKISLIMAGFLIITSMLPTYAQIESSKKKEQKEARYLIGKFKDNWYMSLSGGTAVYFGNEDSKGQLEDRISPIGEISFGKWITPTVSVRASGAAGQFLGMATKPNMFTDKTPGERNLYTQKWKYFNIRADVMFNLSAAIAGYNPKRVYEIIPYIGLGYASSYKHGNKENVFTYDVGLLNKFRISKAWDINLEIAGVNTPKDFDGEESGRLMEGYISVTAGVTYHFRNRGFVRGASYKELEMSQAEIENIKAQLKDQLRTNKVLKRELAYEMNKNAEKCIVEQPAPEPASFIPPTSIFFEIGKSKVSTKGKIRLKFLAKEINDNPNKIYTISGYADSATGTEAYNEKLSQKRAENVFDLLVKYGVKADRLALKAYGGVKDLFPSILESKNLNINPKQPESEQNTQFDSPTLDRVVIIE